MTKPAPGERNSKMSSDQLTTTILGFLKEMDAEANQLVDGYPTRV
jgi:hypothetical protein